MAYLDNIENRNVKVSTKSLKVETQMNLTNMNGDTWTYLVNASGGFEWNNSFFRGLLDELNTDYSSLKAMFESYLDARYGANSFKDRGMIPIMGCYNNREAIALFESFIEKELEKKREDNRERDLLSNRLNHNKTDVTHSIRLNSIEGEPFNVRVDDSGRLLDNPTDFYKLVNDLCFNGLSALREDFCRDISDRFMLDYVMHKGSLLPDVRGRKVPQVLDLLKHFIENKTPDRNKISTPPLRITSRPFSLEEALGGASGGSFSIDAGPFDALSGGHYNSVYNSAESGTIAKKEEYTQVRSKKGKRKVLRVESIKRV